MLLIVGLSSKGESFPVDVLKKVDAVLSALGFRKEVHSVVKPGKQFSITYDGPNTDKSRIEEVLRPVAEQNEVNFSVEIEESVKFP